MTRTTEPDRIPPLKLPDLFIGIACGVGALVAYFACLCPTIGPGDSGELTLAALKLGIAHPPGYALFTWLGRLATTLPFAEPAMAVNFMTARFAAFAVLALFLAARSLPLSRAGAAVTALCFGFSATFWEHATRHEVYTLGMFFLAVLLLLVLRADRRHAKLLLLGSFVLGLAVSHQPTALLWLPGVTLLFLSRPDRAPVRRLVLPGLLLFLLGLSASLGLLVLARTGPGINWGDPSTLSRLWTHITGAQYHGLAFGAPGPVLQQRVTMLPGTWLSELGVPAALLGIGGIVLLGARARLKLLGALLLLATAIFGVAYRVPDFAPHLLPSFLAVALLAGAGTDRIVAALRAYGRPAATVLLILAPGVAFVTHIGPALENRTTLVRDFGRNLAASLAGTDALVYGSDVTRNALAYETRDSADARRQYSAEMLFSETYWDRLRDSLDLPGFEAALKQAGSGPREQRQQKMLATVVQALFERHERVLLATELLTPAFFAGPVGTKYGVLPLGIVNRLLPDTVQIYRPGVLAADSALWSSYTLASARRRHRLPDYENIQLTYASARNNFGMFCLQREWQEEAIASLDSALTFPVSADFRAIVQANRRRALAY